MTTDLRLRAIISGGQSGVMRAALDVAIELGLSHGGICPPARRMDSGTLPPIYKLTESNARTLYQLAVANLRASDGTLILTRHPENMSQFVRGRCAINGRACLTMFPDRFDTSALLAWLVEYQIEVLNVHGPREQSVQFPERNRNYQPGIGAEIHTLLTAFLRPHLELIRANALAHASGIRAESTVTPPGALPAQTAPARPRDPEPHGPPSAPRS